MAVRGRTLDAGPTSRESESTPATRGFLQQVGYALHAALCSDDQSVATLLFELGRVADSMQLHRLRELLVLAMDHLVGSSIIIHTPQLKPS